MALDDQKLIYHIFADPRKRPPIRASRFMNLAQQRYRTDEFHTDYVNFRE